MGRHQVLVSGSVRASAISKKIHFDYDNFVYFKLREKKVQATQKSFQRTANEKNYLFLLVLSLTMRWGGNITKVPNRRVVMFTIQF